MAVVQYWANPYTSKTVSVGTWLGSAGAAYNDISETTEGSTVPTATTDTNYVNKTTTGSTDYLRYSVVTPSYTSSTMALCSITPRVEVYRDDANVNNNKYEVSVYGQYWGARGPEYMKLSSKSWIEPLTTRKWVNGTPAAPGSWVNAVNPGDEWWYNNETGGGYPNFASYEVQIRDTTTNAVNRTRFYEAGLIFEWRSIPSVTSFTADATSIANSTYPKFTWTYADTDDGADSQTGYVLLLYPAASAPTVPTYDYEALYTADVDSGEAYHQMVPGGFAPEIGVSYKAFLRVRKTLQDSVWGDWDSTTFTITATPPVAPTVTASYDSSDNEVDVVVITGHNALSFQNSTFEDAATAGDWSSLSNVTALTNSATQASAGSRSLRLTPSGAVTVQAICGQQHSVSEGDTYYVRADLRGTTGAELCRVGMRWYDRLGATVSTTWSGTSSHATGSWTSFTHSLAAPADAVTASVVVEVQNVASTTDYQYVDKVSFTASNVTWSPGTDGATHLLQRSVDGGMTWVQIPNGTKTDPSWGRYTVKDMPPRGVTASYRAQTTASIGGLYDMTSAWSSTVTAATTTSATWSLQAWDSRGCMKVVRTSLTSNVATLTTESPHGLQAGDVVVVFLSGAVFNGTKTVGSVPTPTTFTYAKTNADVTESQASGYVYVQWTAASAKVVANNLQVVESVGVFRPIGSNRAVVTHGDIYGTDGTMQVTATTAAEWTTLEGVLTSQSPVVIYDPWGNRSVVRIVDRSWQKFGTATSQWWEASVDYVEVSEDEG